MPKLRLYSQIDFEYVTQSSSKWHIYSYIPINKGQIYCYQSPANFNYNFD